MRPRPSRRDADAMTDQRRNQRPVTSPDQRRPGNRRLAYTRALLSAAMLLSLLAADHATDVEIAWVCTFAALLVLTVVVDWQLRHAGCAGSGGSTRHQGGQS
jgi:hypothetical protein